MNDHEINFIMSAFTGPTEYSQVLRGNIAHRFTALCVAQVKDVASNPDPYANHLANMASLSGAHTMLVRDKRSGHCYALRYTYTKKQCSSHLVEPTNSFT